eukprot:g1112.t1
MFAWTIALVARNIAAPMLMKTPIMANFDGSPHAHKLPPNVTGISAKYAGQLYLFPARNTLQTTVQKGVVF